MRPLVGGSCYSTVNRVCTAAVYRSTCVVEKSHREYPSSDTTNERPAFIVLILLRERERERERKRERERERERERKRESERVRERERDHIVHVRKL